MKHVDDENNGSDAYEGIDGDAEDSGPSPAGDPAWPTERVAGWLTKRRYQRDRRRRRARRTRGARFGRIRTR